MNSRIPGIGWTGPNAPSARLPSRPVGSSHKLMRSSSGGAVKIVAPNADKAIRSTITGEAMTASQLIMNTHVMRKTQRGFGPANSGI
jgi:hypothetical protein